MEILTTTTLTAGGVSTPFTTRTIKREALTTGSMQGVNGDGRNDPLWHHAGTGATLMWEMDEDQLRASAMLVANADWQATTTADLGGDGRTDKIRLDTASSPQTTWMRQRCMLQCFPVANPPRPLIADPGGGCRETHSVAPAQIVTAMRTTASPFPSTAPARFLTSDRSRGAAPP